MPNCPRCTKPVYFGESSLLFPSLIVDLSAERVTSIGADWHRPCLRCENEACKKTLAAGSHSEVGHSMMEGDYVFLPSTMESRTAIVAMELSSVLVDTVTEGYGEYSYRSIISFLPYSQVESHTFHSGHTGTV